jgi:hypothetical protein
VSAAKINRCPQSFVLFAGVLLLVSGSALPAADENNQSNIDGESVSATAYEDDGFFDPKEQSLKAITELQASSREVLFATEILVAETDARAHLQDPAFATYVSPTLLATAWDSLAPDLLIDSALQFTEAERILLRQHAVLTSSDLLELAFRAAQEQADMKALARLREVAVATNNGPLLKRVEAALLLGAQSRANNGPLQEIRKQAVSAENFAVLNTLDQTRRTKITLAPLQIALTSAEIEDLPESDSAVREALTETLQENISSVDTAHLVSAEQEEMLDAITGVSRQFGRRLSTSPRRLDRLIPGPPSIPRPPRVKVRIEGEGGPFGQKKGNAVQVPETRLYPYSITNDSSETVHFILPSGKQYSLAPGKTGRYRYLGKNQWAAPKGIRVINTDRKYKLASKAYRFFDMSGNRIGFQSK